MGQRLNLEIWNNGKVLANAYYHWSAYTLSAAEVVKTALNYIKNNTVENENILLYAIRVLEATGAGLTEQEIKYAEKTDCLKNKNFSPCKSRNHGLIGISPNGIQETRFWQEYAARIFIDEARVSFGVFWKHRKWEYEKEQKEEYGREVKTSELTHVEWNTDDIKFDEWEDFLKFIVSLEDEAWVSNVDPCEVIVNIE